MGSKPSKKHRRVSLSAPQVLGVIHSWKTGKLLELAKNAFDYKFQLEHLANPSAYDDEYLRFHGGVESAEWKLGLAQFHAFQAIAPIEQIIGNRSDRDSRGFGLVLASMSGHEEGDEFDWALMMAEANAIAAAQAIHSIFDILANVVYVGLRLGTVKPLDERFRGLSTVAKIAKSRDKVIGTSLEKIQKSDHFRYLNAWVNTTKHRRLLDRNFGWDIVEPRKVGLSFSAFKYEGEIFPSKWLDDFLRDSIALAAGLLTTTGKRLETLLASECKRRGL